MTFNVLDHLGITVPVEPILPITSQSTRTPGSSRLSQPISLLASLSGSRVSNAEPVAQTPPNYKVMRLSATPLHIMNSQSGGKDPIILESNVEPLLSSTTKSMSNSASSAVKTDTLVKLLTSNTVSVVDYSLSIDEKAALLPLLESTEKEARDLFNKRNTVYLQQVHRPDTEAARLQLETIMDNKRKANEEKQERLKQERQEIKDILTEIYTERTADNERELKKKTDYQREVEEFRRQEDEIKKAQDFIKQTEKEAESRKAHEYMNEMKLRAAQEAEQRRLEAIKNQEFVDALIESKRQAKISERVAERMMDCYIGPEDRTDILQAHKMRIKEFLKDANDEARHKRDQRAIEEKEQQERDREDTRAIRRDIHDAQLNYITRKKEEAVALKQEYDRDMHFKKMAKQQEKELEKQEAQNLKLAVSLEEQKTKFCEHALAHQHRTWLKKSLGENIREKEINTKFNMLLDKIKEYK
ncbi:Hypothetical protein GLP15_3751 [Giardia lamblia P15]|uniref:Uncharacterized protein n=1 Tax=Giardia intestinalis (strain P15) TaxID=658858 RepID=E1F279_GIAIA|nr:Hypothetical protein GLP15_3751 [Giardia lamblia P15]